MSWLMNRSSSSHEPSPSRGTGEKRASDQPDQGESANMDGQDASPTPVGFWDHRLKHVRLEVFRKWCYTTVVLMAFVLGVLSIYWAVFFHLPANFKKLVIYIVDMDGAAPYTESATGHAPFVGPAITELASQMMLQPDTLGYRLMPGSAFNNDPIQVRQAIYNREAWAAIVVNPNATALLYRAIDTGNTSYDPLGACQLIYLQARDQTTYDSYITPLLATFTTTATSNLGTRWTLLALRRAGTTPAALTNLRAAPQALSPAIGFSAYNLRPFFPYTATPPVSIGLIYLIIISFFSFSFYLPIHTKLLQSSPPLRFPQLIAWRWLATVAAYLLLSLAYSLLSLAFRVNFAYPHPATPTEPTPTALGNPAAFGRGTFPVYWMLYFVGMLALGLASENAAMAVGQPWMGLWLIFWVISNVSTSFYDIDTEPGFFRWGYAWPLHHIVHASRTILFDLDSQLGLNFGVLFAWAAVNTALFPFMCYWMRYKNQHGLREYWA